MPVFPPPVRAPPGCLRFSAGRARLAKLIPGKAFNTGYMIRATNRRKMGDDVGEHGSVGGRGENVPAHTNASIRKQARVPSALRRAISALNYQQPTRNEVTHLPGKREIDLARLSFSSFRAPLRIARILLRHMGERPKRNPGPF